MLPLPDQTPDEHNVVLPSRDEVTAVICEAKACQVLVVAAQDGQQVARGHLQRQEEMQNETQVVLPGQPAVDSS